MSPQFSGMHASHAMTLSITGSEQAATPHITPISTTLPLSTVREVPSAIAPLPTCISQPKQPSEEPTQLWCSGCVHFPLHTICKIEAGKGIDPTMCKVPQPEPKPVDPDMPGLTPVNNEPDKDEVEDLVGSAWTVFQDAPALLEDFPGLEYVFMAETADAKALEPCMLAEAKHRPDWPLWEKAIEEELAMLKATGTWKLEEAPPGANIIGSKWVFKVKKDAAGNIFHYKARLVTQGFSQIRGVDYDDTYAPVAHLASSCVIIVMANHLDLELHQVDIKGAYLNGVLNDDEVLYMQHPPGYKAQGIGCLMLCLLKTLYGLKQSGWHWYQKLSSIFASLSFKQCSIDQAVFYKTNKEQNALTVVAVHVDNCMIAASSDKLTHKLIEGLHKQLEVTDLGGLHWMLRLEIQHDHVSGTMHLSQHVYIDSILCHYNLTDLKPLSMPMDTLIWLSTKQAPASVAECMVMCDVPYCKAIGALNWAALTTHPDIAFTVATVARFAANPSPAHWEAVKRIFHYLAGTCDLWLSYGERK